MDGTGDGSVSGCGTVGAVLALAEADGSAAAATAPDLAAAWLDHLFSSKVRPLSGAGR